MTEKPRIILGLSLLTILAALLAALVFVPLPDANQNAILIVIGNVTALTSTLVTYYFGTSDGSKRKTDLLIKQNESAIGKAGDPVHIEQE